MNLVRYKIYFVVLFLVSHAGYSQTNIYGNIQDKQNQKALIGVQVLVNDTTQIEGTISDRFGSFDLSTEKNPPFTLKFFLLGYEEKIVKITENEQYIKVVMKQGTQEGEKVFIESSKVGEEVWAPSKLFELVDESPVSVDKLEILDLNNSPYADYYESFANLNEAQATVSSRTLHAINTRGFTSVQNWRFVQHLDGVELTPGLNFSLGNMLGSSFLDIRHVELVPGTASALYGPNTFNGLLSMYTKNPFDYPGVSVHLSTGLTQQDGVGSKPFLDTEVRVAQILNPKWAFKLNLGYLNAYDWEGRDESFHIRPELRDQQEDLLQRPRNHPNFDAIHVYGDEVVTQVDLFGDGSLFPINRTGFRESDLIDYNINNINASAGIYYKPTPTMEASYQFRFTEGDGVLRHGAVFPLANLQNFIHRIGVQGRDFSFLGYHSSENTQDSYQLLATGGFIQQSIKSNEEWAREYGLAFQGQIPGVEEAQHDEARAFADRDVPGMGSVPFNRLLEQTRSNSDFTTGGSRFIDRSSMLHLEGNYSLDTLTDWVDLQVGASFRRHQLDSEGQFFNDGPLGFGDPIGITDIGAYVQGSKSLKDDRILIRASVRFDKNSNFSPRISPRISGRYALDPNKVHTLRFSVQQGFRNPSPIEGFMAKDLVETVSLGGLETNITNFQYALGDQTFVSGEEIFNSLVTRNSYQAFLNQGGTNTELFVDQSIDFLQQEQITAFELGYNGQVSPKITIDANVYFNQYRDFVNLLSTYSPLVDRVFSIYTNVEEQITSLGGNIRGDIKLPRNYLGTVNFTYTSFDADEAIQNNPGFLPGFNTPELQAQVGIANYNFWNNVGFSSSYRWVDGFTWQSPFGEGEVESYGSLDVAFLYNIPDLNVRLKLGGTNLLGTEYQTLYGGPYIGSQYFFSFIFDTY